MNQEDGLTLNDEQKKAVKMCSGPLLIIAGPGTGKTFVIVEKIKYLIQKKLAKPENILALTFTEKSAREMEERVDRAMPYGYFQMWISTFHAFADQILKEEAGNIGIPSEYKLMNEAESLLFFRNNLFLFNFKYFRPLGNPNKFVKSILQHFSRLKDENISPNEYIAWMKKFKKRKNIEKEEKEKYEELALVYKDYQKLKIRKSVFDFSDLVFYLVRLFKKRPHILKKYRQQFKYVLVDEFQDTNIAQYELLKLICPNKKNPNLTVVGDDSQAIYKFRGASVSNILSFMKDYNKTKLITLKVNYRSNQNILDHAYKLIKHNNPDTLESKLNISKNLISKKEGNKQAIYFMPFESAEEEADFTAIKIKKLAKTYKYSDFAILVRANNHSYPFTRSLIRHGIPFQFLGPGMLFKKPEVKDLIAYLNILCNLEDSSCLYKVLLMDIFEIDIKDISMMLSFSKKTSQSLFQAIEIYLSFHDKSIYKKEYEIFKEYLPIISRISIEKLTLIYKMIIKHLSLIKKETAGQILYYFLEDTGLLQKLGTYKNEKQEKVALNISMFFDKLKTYEIEHQDSSVFALVDYIDMSMELGESPTAAQIDATKSNAVNILTVHSSKGLEFPVIFLVNLIQGRFPVYERKLSIQIPNALIKEILPQGNYHEQEERRLFYVGLARAKDKVYLTASKYYKEGKRARKISSFVFETLGKDIVEKKLFIKKAEKSQLSIFDYKKAKEPIIKQIVKSHSFSYSQLESYRICPLQYKYQYILKIPILPTSPSSFGISIHKTLYMFYKKYMENINITKKSLIDFYNKSWKPIGYTSKLHKEKMKTQGKYMLLNYYKTYHNKDIKIIELEKLFKIKISNDIFITGKIDRVNKTTKGGIEIIDYKTGKEKSEKEIKKDMQMSLYALAASNKGLFNKKLDNITLTFYFLNSNKKISLKRTEKDIKKLKQDINKIVSEIRKDEFLPNVSPICDFCPYHIICSAWR